MRGFAAALAVGAACAATAIPAGCGGEDAPDPDSATEGSGPVDAPPPRVQRYRVPGRPGAISAGAGYVWVTDQQGGDIQRINPRSKQPIAVQSAGFPTDVSADGDAAWLALADGGAIQRVTATEGANRPIDVEGFPFRVAAGEGAVWAMSQGSIERIDPDSGQAGGPIELEDDLSSIAAGAGAVWVAREAGELLKLDPADGTELESIDVERASLVTTGESAAWVLRGPGDEGEAEIQKVDSSGSPAGNPIPVGRSTDIAVGLGFVWVLTAPGKLMRFDPDTGASAGDPVVVGKAVSVTVGEGSAWVASAAQGSGVVYRVTP